jgi:hypothetical protein
MNRILKHLNHTDWTYARRLEANLKLSEARLAEARREAAAWRREFDRAELEHGNKRRDLERMLSAASSMLKDQRWNESMLCWLALACIVLASVAFCLGAWVYRLST